MTLDSNQPPHSAQHPLLLPASSVCLPVTLELEELAAAPGGPSGGPEAGGLGSLDLQTAGLAARSGLASHLAMLVLGLADPVDACVIADSCVLGIHHDHLVELVGSVLTHPVRVQHAEVATNTAAHTRLGQGAEVHHGLLLVHTLVLGLSVNDTLGNVLLAVSTADAHPVDDVALLGLVTKVAGLVRAGGAGSPVHRGEVPELPAADALHEAHDVRLLLPPELFHILVGAHLCNLSPRGGT
mmetsp:Transcript_15338/g.31102  ORF Transcript_15338/g.31102 Transcript_15338/m.31102 type:complete len:241 (+) Transcript_15338:470-1192(+)